MAISHNQNDKTEPTPSSKALQDTIDRETKELIELKESITSQHIGAITSITEKINVNNLLSRTITFGEKYSDLGNLLPTVESLYSPTDFNTFKNQVQGISESYFYISGSFAGITQSGFELIEKIDYQKLNFRNDPKFVEVTSAYTRSFDIDAIRDNIISTGALIVEFIGIEENEYEKQLSYNFSQIDITTLSDERQHGRITIAVRNILEKTNGQLKKLVEKVTRDSGFSARMLITPVASVRGASKIKEIAEYVLTLNQSIPLDESDLLYKSVLKLANDFENNHSKLSDSKNLRDDMDSSEHEQIRNLVFKSLKNLEDIFLLTQMKELCNSNR